MIKFDKNTEFPITRAWKKGQLAVKENNMDEARDWFDSGIAMVATYSIENNEFSDDSIIENKTRKLWLMRFWKVGLENNNLLLG
tara:strand:+ start:314 stop:565 length:252 start_codon:yes stop_codon:yes gene_type:complete